MSFLCVPLRLFAANSSLTQSEKAMTEWVRYTDRMKTKTPLLLACLLCVAAPFFRVFPSFAQDIAPNVKTPHVAVFYEPGFPYNGVDTQTSPPAIAYALQANGIKADLLDEAALTDIGRFNAHSYAALVLAYGNNYPLKAFASMRAFHQAGGSLILSGIPFTHPVTRSGEGKDGGKWTDLGHRGEAALFGPQGIGVGGFTGPSDDIAPFVAPNDPLGLVALPLAWYSDARSQRLDPQTLPVGDILIPVVGDPKRPSVAIVLHDAPPYKGAIDVWAHHGPEGDLEAWATQQLLLRGTLYALNGRGLVSDAQLQTAYARFAALPKPAVYANIVLPVVPRPYATFQPKMPPPARHLYVADVRRLTRDERILLISLQGIVNRVQPRIYLIFKDDDRFWLRETQRQRQTDAPIVVLKPLSLVARFRQSVRGVVVSDPKIYVSPCVAACVSGADNLLMATPELAQRLNLPIRTDLRGKFKTDADALRYIRTRLLPRLDTYLSCCLDPAIFDTGALDQIIAAKGVVFWITGTKAQGLPGANGMEELEEIKKTLAVMPLNGVTRGFWWHGEDMGLNESPGVSLASRFGKVSIVSDYVANFSVLSGAIQPDLKQKPHAAPPALDPAKVYFSFTMSDGDNLCTWRDYFRSYFTDPLHGTIPVGWGMGPTLLDNAPVWARWYYDHATPNDEFLCDVSGVGYIYGPDWATALKDRSAAFADFYRWTAQYMRRLDMHTLRLMNVSADDIAQAARLLPDTRFLMPDYGNPGDKPYSALTYETQGGQTVFRAITGADGGADRLAEQIRMRVGTTRPAFINVFIWNWGSKMRDLKRIQELLGPEYVAVLPSQLNTLYRQARSDHKKQTESR